MLTSFKICLQKYFGVDNIIYINFSENLIYIFLNGYFCTYYFKFHLIS